MWTEDIILENSVMQQIILCAELLYGVDEVEAEL